MFPVLQCPNLILPSCPFCVAGDSESDSDFPLWVGFPHYLISPPAPWMDFSISWHAGNFLLAARQPQSKQPSSLSPGHGKVLMPSRGQLCSKKKTTNKQTLRHQMPFCMYTDLFLISHPATLALLLGSKTASLWEQSMSSTQGTLTVPGLWVVSTADTLEGQRNAISQQGCHNSPLMPWWGGSHLEKPYQASPVSPGPQSMTFASWNTLICCSQLLAQSGLLICLTKWYYLYSVTKHSALPLGGTSTQ